MLRQTLIRGRSLESIGLSSLFRQLHIGNNGRHLVPDNVSPMVWLRELPKSVESLCSVDGTKRSSALSVSPTPLLAQARQEIMENPFQYRIRPSIGIPPEMIRRPEYRTPISHSVITPLEIPGNGESENKEIKDSPTSPVLEKQAARLIVIRRRKMNKHKLGKLRKKMKYTWAKVKQRRAIRKEKAYLDSKMALIKAAKAFDAKEFVAGVIKRAKEEPIAERWRDPLMPEWYKEQELARIATNARYQKMINLYLNREIKIDFSPKKK